VVRSPGVLHTDGAGYAELAERLRSGEPGAFEANVARHGAALRRCCIATAGSVDRGEEAHQRTLLILHRRGRTLRDGARLAAWLQSVVRREAFRVRRRTALGGRLTTADQAVRAIASGPHVDPRTGLMTHFDRQGTFEGDDPPPTRRWADVGPDGRLALESLAPGSTEVDLRIDEMPGLGPLREVKIRDEPLGVGEAREPGDVRLPVRTRGDAVETPRGAASRGEIVLP
jgi:hypothetical protein